MIFLAGNYGFGSLGDEAILAAALARLRDRRPGLRVTAASGNPRETSAAHGIEAVAWDDLPALHRAVRASDAVVIGGGALFEDASGVDPDTFLTNRHSGLASHAGPALLATLYRKPLMLCAVGVGPLASGYGAQLTRMAARMARILTVRDQGSKAALEELDIPSAKIQVTADLAFARIAAAVPSAPRTARRPVLGVVPHPHLPGVHPDFLTRELAAALDLFLQQNGGSVLLLAREAGRPAAARILEHMRLRDHAAISEPATPGQADACLQACDLLLAMSFDDLVLAACAGVPAVPVSGHPAVDELASRLALGDFTLDVKNLRAPRIASRLAEVLRCRDLLVRPLQMAVEDLRRAAETNISCILELLDGPPADAGLCPEDYDLLARTLAARPPSSGPVPPSPDPAVVATLRAELQRAAGECTAAQRARDDYAARLRDAGHARAAVLSDLDRYAALFRDNLAVYRGQRAWKMMLVLRKAYSLLARAKSRFFTWALGLPFGRVGPLDEYELAFPDIANYIPDTFRQPWNGLPAAATATAPSASAAEPPEPETPPQRDRFDVVILAIIDFDFRFQRPQQIAAEFARQGHRVLWISPTRFLPPSSPEPYKIVPLRENLWEIHLRSRQPDIYLGELLPSDVTQMSEALAALYRDWTVGEHTVFVQLPFWRRLALGLRDSYGACLLYDCMDDWETFENMGSFNVAEEKYLVRECDVLIVTGAELERKFRAQGLNPVLARNGADYPFFAKARSNALLDGLPRPVVGYFGAIADWIDLNLVYEVAKSRPQYSFVLIGQVFGRDTSLLEALPNVRLLGNKPYPDIPAYLHNFDACTIPFLINQVTKATDPVKLYEYFSLGKPVVATNMAELAQCGDLLYIGHNPEDFAQKLDLAISEKDPALPRRRTQFAQANTWTSRVDDISGAIRQSFPLVSILVVTHKSAPFVRPCLDSILRNTAYPACEVLLVDNASTDDTPALLQEYAARDPRFRLALLPENLGFAGGNNHAAREARGQYLIFLNIDTMVTAGWIGRLLRHLRRDPSIGLLCPVTNFAGNEVKINVSYTGWQSMEKFARSLAASKSGARFEIGVAPLYCALMPRAIWEQVGEMDARYEIGMFEDDDLSLRVRQAGFGVFAAEDCFIHHFGQGSFAKLPTETYNRIFEANRKRFEEKWRRPWVPHHPRPGVRPAFEETRFDPVRFLANG